MTYHAVEIETVRRIAYSLIGNQHDTTLNYKPSHSWVAVLYLCVVLHVESHLPAPLDEQPDKQFGSHSAANIQQSPETVMSENSLVFVNSS